MIFIFIWLTILFGLVIVFRIARSYYAYNEKSDKTECPRCSHKTSRKEKGRHICEQCQFEFDVNRKGDAEKYPKSEIYVGAFLTLLFSVATFFSIIEFVESYHSTGEINIKHVIILAAISYIALTNLIGIFSSLKGYKFYESQKKP